MVQQRLYRSKPHTYTAPARFTQTWKDWEEWRPEHVWRKVRGWATGVGSRGRAVWMEHCSKRTSDPGSCGFNLWPGSGQSRETRSARLWEQVCVEEASVPPQSLESAAMLVSRGSWRWTALMWKHLQHTSLGEVWEAEVSSRRLSPGRHPRACVLYHPTLRAPLHKYTVTTNTRGSHNSWNCRERVHISPIT